MPSGDWTLTPRLALSESIRAPSPSRYFTSVSSGYCFPDIADFAEISNCAVRVSPGPRNPSTAVSFAGTIIWLPMTFASASAAGESPVFVYDTLMRAVPPGLITISRLSTLNSAPFATVIPTGTEGVARVLPSLSRYVPWRTAGYTPAAVWSFTAILTRNGAVPPGSNRPMYVLPSTTWKVTLSNGTMVKTTSLPVAWPTFFTSPIRYPWVPGTRFSCIILRRTGLTSGLIVIPTGMVSDLSR